MADLVVQIPIRIADADAPRVKAWLDRSASTGTPGSDYVFRFKVVMGDQSMGFLREEIKQFETAEARAGLQPTGDIGEIE